MNQENKEYVKPPEDRNKKVNIGGIKNVYKNLHPSYWKRKLVHLVIVIPFNWLIYYSMIMALFGTNTMENTSTTLNSLVTFLTFILIVISAFFYPYSLYWYKGSFLGRFFNNLYHFGSIWSVFAKVIGTIVGGVMLAGVLSPITGPLTYKKIKKQNLIIGDEKDFV